MLPSFARTILQVCLAVLALATAGTARAQIGSERYASIVIDAASGNILSSVNADEYRYPASLTKMMTLYMLFEALRDRRVSLQQYVPVDTVAASMPPTKLGLVPGSLITVEQAILGLVTKSANDAACALGIMLGGDEERFAQMMTVRARALGMTHSQFRNASGLPDWNQVTSARDMAVLARHLIQDFPAYYHYFSTPSFVYGGRFVPNHQRLLQTYPGADGMKTGYTEASGYNVVTSAVRGDTRLIGVVLGAAHGGERDLHMAALMDQGYDRLGIALPPVAPPVASALVARRDPLRLPAFIGVARAAPMPPPSARVPVRLHTQRPPTQMQGQMPVDRAATRRPASLPRNDRSPVAAAEPRLRPNAAAMQMQVVRPVTTRTAHQSPPNRFPG